MTNTTTTKTAPPKAFVEVFAKLVSRTQQTGRLEAGTAGHYYELLARFPLDIIAASATRLAETQTFFPSVAEWLTTCERLCRVVPPGTTCLRCHDRGLLRVDYVDTGEPFDIAICDCAKGHWFRENGEEAVRRYLPQLSAENHVGPLEQFTDREARHAR